MSNLESLSLCAVRELAATGAIYATLNGRIVNVDELKEKPPALRLHIRVLGGKGGFGSLLRSFRFHKSSNEDMCRDLSGRRLRDVKEEAKLKKWIASKAQREAEKEAKSQAKYEKLKAGPAKHVFQDPEYHKTGEEILDKIEDAVASGLKAAECVAVEEEKSGTLKRKAQSSAKGAVLKKKLKTQDPWLAVDLSDLSDSSDDEGEGEETSEGAVEVEGAGPDVASSSWTFASAATKTLDDEPTSSSTAGLKASAETHRNKLLRMLTGPKSVPSPSVQLKSFEKKDPDTTSTPIQKPQTPARTKKEEKKEEVPTTFEPIDLENCASAEEISANHTIHHLKAELIRRGLKCGGSGAERAQRLWLVRGLKDSDIPQKIRAKQ